SRSRTVVPAYTIVQYSPSRRRTCLARADVKSGDFPFFGWPIVSRSLPKAGQSVSRSGQELSRAGRHPAAGCEQELTTSLARETPDVGQSVTCWGWTATPSPSNDRSYFELTRGSDRGPRDPMSNAPVTLLFTDLVNSTELLQRAGDEQTQRIFRAH